MGRAPHEATFRPDGKEVWVTIRGQDYVQILDAGTFEPLVRVQVCEHGKVSMSTFF